MTLAEQLDLRVYRHRRTGRWMVSSRDLARHTAHEHGNILSAARLAEEELFWPDYVVWDRYEGDRTRRSYPCCWIPAIVLTQMRLHNVPGCRYVRDVIDEYLRLLDMHEAAQPARVPVVPLAKPAPDTEIRPPDPEPADTLKPVPPWKVSWQITEAVDLLTKFGAPDDAMQCIKKWNNDRRWFELQGLARSWADVSALHNTGRMP